MPNDNQTRPTKNSSAGTGQRKIKHYERSAPQEQSIPSESLMDIRLTKKTATVDQIVRYSLKSKGVGDTNRFYLERWAERCGAVRLQMIRPAVLRDYVDRGQSTGSQRRELGALIAAVNHWLRENDPTGMSSQLTMMRPRENPPRDRVVSADEELAMEMAFSKELWAIVRFCLRTGARPFEARQMVGGDVNADKRWVKLKHKKGSGSLLVREVPIMDDAVMDDLLGRVKLFGRDEVFRCPSGMAWSRTNLASQWEAYKALAGLADLQWTDLRHTFATRMGRAGVNATTIADLLGHTNLGLVQRYVQVTSLDREAAARLGIA